jgi:CheY-like chemotaxis protein
MDATANPILSAANPPPARSVEAVTNEILIAEDQPVSRHLLERYLSDWGFHVQTAVDGEEAVKILESDSAPPLAIIDWGMPRLNGLEVCRRVRANREGSYTYLLLLTARNKSAELLAGLSSGADDYVTKPYDPDELRSRIRVGQRVVALERSLKAQVVELEDALAHVKTLKGLLPICMYCKRIRDDQSYWHQVEKYIHEAVGTEFSHGVCPKCVSTYYRDLGLPEPSTP